jgi:hypothetical protein
VTLKVQQILWLQNNDAGETRESGGVLAGGVRQRACRHYRELVHA